MSVEFTSLHLAIALAVSVLTLGLARSALGWRAGEGVLVKHDAAVWSPRSALVAAALACAVLATVLRAGSAAQALTSALFMAGLGYLAVIDARTQLVPVWPTVLFAGAGVALHVFLGAGSAYRLLEAVAAGVVMLALASAYRLLRNRDGLGAGDALVVAAIAAWIGASGAAWSVAIGAVVMLGHVVLFRNRADAPMALVPGLAIGALVVVLRGGLA